MSLANRLRLIRDKFEGLWGPADTLICAQAPGRVNLIGEHTDYNDGYVLPMAIDQDIIIAGRPNNRNFARIYSFDLNSQIEFHTKRLDVGGLPHWVRYLIGAANRVVAPVGDIPGFDAVIHSTLPIGASLSSSAAFVIAGSLFMGSIAGVSLSRKEVALGCQQVEHQDIGVRCGIMDQMVILYARASCALFIDCRSLMYEWIPFDMNDCAVCICDTGVTHELAATAYNKRRADCDEAVKILAQRIPGVRALRDVTADELEAASQALPAKLLMRARHVVSENQRVLDSVEALRKKDCASLGRLMNESHESLRANYEVSSPELDVLVEAAGSVPGTLGARLTGGGFSGCTVNLVRSGAITSFSEAVSESYAETFGRTPKIYISAPVRGARVFEDRPDGTQEECEELE